MGGGGCEGPAGAALTLIFDGGDDVFVSPVDLSSEPEVDGLGFDGFDIIAHLAEVESNELLLS